MAKLPEHEGKLFLKRGGVPVPLGEVAADPEECRQIAERLGGPVVVKAQVSTGGRGKAGAIRVAETPAEAAAAGDAILNSVVKGNAVKRVLVEEKLDIAREFYVSYTVDSRRTARRPLLMFSMEGGVDIEAVPDEQLVRMLVSPSRGPEESDLADLLRRAGVASGLVPQLVAYLRDLFAVYKTCDCTTLEINPSVITESGQPVAADCKMEIDNNAVFRHPEMGITVARDFGHEATELDLIGWGIEEADQRGSGFLMSMGFDEKTPGYIGYHPIGGGSAMVGMDALSKVGLKVANYADTSGNPVASKVYRIARVVLAQPGIEGYFLAGFMMANQEQWHHAHAIVKALREALPTRPGLPCILLICGNKEKESLAILREGLRGVRGAENVEIYGSEYVTDTAFISQRVLTVVKEYHKTRRG